MSIKETVSLGRQVPNYRVTGSRRFGMLPKDFLARVDVKPAAKIVLAAMQMESYVYGGVTISHSAIGKLCGLSRTHVLKSIAELEIRGLIERDGAAEKQIQPYRLLHPRMAAKNRLIDAAKLPVCSDCRLPRKSLPKTGVCRSCVDVERWKSAHSKLGDAATYEEICKYLDVESSKKKWHRVAEKASRAA